MACNHPGCRPCRERRRQLRVDVLWGLAVLILVVIAVSMQN